MKINYSLLFISLFIFSCNGKKTTNEETNISDTPNSGTISISVDSSLFPLLKDEVEIFENQNTNAKIELIAQPESKGIQEFLENKNRAVITTRKLTDDEIKFGKQNNLVPIHFSFAYDAVAFIVNKKNGNTIYNSAQIENILKGKDENKTIIVFDNNGASEIQYIKNKFSIQKFSSNTFSTNGFSELLKYVTTHENAMGVIGVSNLIFDTDSLISKNASVISIEIAKGEVFAPTEQNIRDGNYPFRREVYIACGESWPGLGTGFAKFIITDIGQTIIKRSGLIPSRQSMRNIEIKKEF